MAVGPQTTDNPQVPNQEFVEAVVTVGEVSFTDEEGKYKDIGESDKPDLPTDYMIYARYEKDRGVYMGGLTSPAGFQGRSVAFVQIKNPTLLFLVDWTAAKLGKQPDIPDPNINDANWVLMDDWYVPAPVTVGPDGVTALYRISGLYVYGHVGPAANTNNNVTFPLVPWLQDVFDRTLPSTVLKQGISVSLQGTATGQVQGQNALQRFVQGSQFIKS